MPFKRNCLHGIPQLALLFLPGRPAPGVPVLVSPKLAAGEFETAIRAGAG